MNLLDRQVERGLIHSRPMKASLELTYRCNERCGHCYLDSFRDDPKRKLSLSDWYHVLDELRGAGVLFVVLMGGEAMLHPHFWEIADRATGMGFSTSMITNGLLIDEGAALRLRALGFALVTVSLYSLDPEVHDQMTRRRGSHGRLMEAVAHLRRAGVSVGVNCLLTRRNIDSFFELERWCQAEGLALQADTVVTSRFSGDLTPTVERATRAQLLWFYREQALRGRGPRPQPVDPQSTVCGVGRAKCAVTAYGELLPCIEVRDPLGSLLEDSFATLWSGAKAQRWRTLGQGALEGRPSGVRGEFCEHCPGMAWNETKNPLGVLPFTRELAEVKAQVAEEAG